MERTVMRRLKSDNNAALEGLPLYLLIMVIIAAVGISVVMGWMNMIGGPKAIDDVMSQPDEILITGAGGSSEYSNTSIEITIVVYDQDGNPLAGAMVVLDGEGLTILDADNTAPTAVTDANGKVMFTDLNITKTMDSIGIAGYVGVDVTKSGYTSYSENNKILVKNRQI